MLAQSTSGCSAGTLTTKPAQFFSTAFTCVTSPPSDNSLTVGRERAASSERPRTVNRNSSRCLVRTSMMSARSPVLVVAVVVAVVVTVCVVMAATLGAQAVSS